MVTESLHPFSWLIVTQYSCPPVWQGDDERALRHSVGPPWAPLGPGVCTVTAIRVFGKKASWSPSTLSPTSTLVEVALTSQI